MKTFLSEKKFAQFPKMFRFFVAFSVIWVFKKNLLASLFNLTTKFLCVL